jgi:hypothetical protein
MWKKNKGIVLILVLFVYNFSFGQTNDHLYKRQLKGVKDQWHKILLPLDMYAKVSEDLSDVRIYGYTQNGDTSEVPYITQIPESQALPKELEFSLINSAAKSDGFYFTFQMADQVLISEIMLYFVEQNYDWKIKLEGSQDLKDWFTIVDNYRILSIKNGITDYQFGKVLFPPSKYNYFRFFIKSKEKPTLQQAKVLTIQKLDIPLSKRQNKYTISENKKEKTTTVDIILSSFVPVSEVSIYSEKKIEFYRSFELKVLRDSTKLASGSWTYHYGNIKSGTFSSLDDNQFSFNNTWTKKLRCIIQNHDNAPVRIDSIQISGPDYYLIGRFDDKNMPFYLVYGDKRLYKPTYDIAHFTTPDSVANLELGDEEMIKLDVVPQSPPLFENKWWLWILMVAIIIVLGGFTLKMMKGTS